MNGDAVAGIPADRAVRIDGRVTARAALIAGGMSAQPVWMISQPGVVFHAGVPWLLQAVAAAEAETGQAADGVIVDCDTSPGAVILACRSGVPWLAFRGTDDMTARLVDIAAQSGARLIAPPASIHPGSTRPETLAEWLLSGQSESR